MIPKVIHYCWFGGNPLPESVLEYIESWKKFCPDYEIKEWNADNFDVSCCPYVEEAAAMKKWAFVSDYCRFYVLYREGGVYMDTDVELIKPIDDLQGAVVGFDRTGAVNSGSMRIAPKGDKICGMMLESYHQDRFLKNNEPDFTTVCIREMRIFQSLGLILDNTLQRVAETTIYPAEYFDPKDYRTGEVKMTENTYSIHHYDSSWFSDTEKYAAVLRKKLSRCMSDKLAGRTAYFLAQCKYHGIRRAVVRTIHKLKGK